MTKGLEIRAQIDSDVVKGLLLLNGGGAVALLALLPSVIGEPEFKQLSLAILWALLSFQVGLVSAVIHNRFRRLCSLEHERHDYDPPDGSFLGIHLKQPNICFYSTFFMWASLGLFVIGGLIVFLGGICNL